MVTVDLLKQHNVHCVYAETNTPSDDYQLHCHNHYEVYYLLEGPVSYLAEGTCYEPQPHTLMVFPPRLFHGVKVLSDAPYKRYTMFFRDTSLPLELRSFLLSVFPTGQDLLHQPLYFSDASGLHLEPFFEALIRCKQLDPSIGNAMSAAYLQATLGQLTMLRTPSAPPTPSVKEQRVLDVLHYLNDHLEEAISLDSLSARFFLSKNYLNTIFKEATGTTIAGYLNHKRIIRAQQLLFDGYRATDASTAVGFTDYSAFFRSYEKILGHSPSQDKGNPVSSVLFTPSH